MFKKINLNFILVFCIGLVCFMAANSVLNNEQLEFHLLNKNNEPNKFLLEIAKIAGLDVNDSTTVQELVNKTQASWLRQGERWEMDHLKFNDLSKYLMPLLKKLGMLNDENPDKKRYKYAFVLGATDTTVITRLHHLNELIKNDLILVDNIIILSGDRKLLENEKQRMFNTFKIHCENEFEMMKSICECRNITSHFEGINIVYVNAMAKKLPDGRTQRPTTGDTINEWLSSFKPESGDCIAISTQPYVIYQDAVLKTYLPKEFNLKTIGKFDDKRELSIALYLDTLARTLYQENIKLKNKKD